VDAMTFSSSTTKIVEMDRGFVSLKEPSFGVGFNDIS
jgi:hypothetical protein